jgi:hypothetical protein
MYYWNKVTENKTSMEDELANFDKPREIVIATAFISFEGLNIVKRITNKYNLNKDRIKIFLSSEFTQDKPHELLVQLNSFSTVKIIFDRFFHSKVYLIKGTNQSKIIFGSSNLTIGGFKNNIEFNYIDIVENSKLESIWDFFKFCEIKAIPINDDIIRYYEDNYKEIEQLNEINKKLRKKLNRYFYKDDALDNDILNIDNFYFTFEDYETFFKRNQARGDIEIKEKRKRVRNKLLRIHKKIYKSIKEMGLECHWRDENITSLIEPRPFNNGRVGWLGVRYGKTKKEIDTLNFNSTLESKIGFQKHACLQYSLIPSGFEITLFLAVKHDAIDRQYLHDKIRELQPKIEEELSKLKGLNMTWEIYDEENDENFSFDINEEDERKFCDYFKKNDKEGRESFLRMYYEANDIRIKNIDNISKEIIKYMKLLLPLYNSMVYRLK